MKFRLITDLIIFMAVINGWWFIVVPLGLIGAWKYNTYIELLIAGIAYDALFGFNHPVGILGYIGTIVSVLILISMLILKKVMR